MVTIPSTWRWRQQVFPDIGVNPQSCTVSRLLTMIIAQKCFPSGRYVYCYKSVSFGGTRWRSWLRHCATSRKVAGSIPDGDVILPATLGPEVDSTYNRNEYQGYLLVADNLTTFNCRLFRNSGSLDLLERQGPVHACIGVALPTKYTAVRINPKCFPKQQRVSAHKASISRLLLTFCVSCWKCSVRVETNLEFGII